MTKKDAFGGGALIIEAPLTQFWTFQHAREIECDLRNRISAAQFSENVRRDYGTYFPDDNPPDEALLSFLYEQALVNAVIRQESIAKKAAVRPRQWRQYRRWSRDALKTIRELKRILSMPPARVAPNLINLIQDALQPLGRLNDLMSTTQQLDQIAERMANDNTHNLSLQLARGVLDSALRWQASHLSKAKRTQLISSAIIAIGLKATEDVEATQRGLRRLEARRKKKKKKSKKS
jgi:hypothetical protein